MDKYYKFVNGKSLKINSIWCVGRNYADHAKEMGASTESEPIIFLKASTSAVLENKFALPDFSDDVHFETELVVVINQDIHNVEAENARQYIAGIGLGLDLTLRDIQSELKKKSLPWALSKSFYQSAPLSEIIDIDNINIDRLKFEMSLNGKLTQSGDTNDMIFSIEELISYISKRFSLQKGDCIMTGTPAGVGKLNSKDKIKATLENKLNWELEVL